MDRRMKLKSSTKKRFGNCVNLSHLNEVVSLDRKKVKKGVSHKQKRIILKHMIFTQIQPGQKLHLISTFKRAPQTVDLLVSANDELKLINRVRANNSFQLLRFLLQGRKLL